MYHPATAIGNKRICPVTKKLFDMAWTDHNLPGCFNKCKQCFPEEYISVGQKLAELNKEKT